MIADESINRKHCALLAIVHAIRSCVRFNVVVTDSAIFQPCFVGYNGGGIDSVVNF